MDSYSVVRCSLVALTKWLQIRTVVAHPLQKVVDVAECRSLVAVMIWLVVVVYPRLLLVVECCSPVVWRTWLAMQGVNMNPMQLVVAVVECCSSVAWKKWLEI